MVDKRKIVNKMKSICFNVTNFSESTRFSKLWTREGLTVSINTEEAKAFNQIVYEFLLNPLINENFSLQDVSKKVEEIISRVLKAPRERREEKIKNEIDDFLSDIESNTHDWIFILPLENLELSVRSIKFNNIKLLNFSKYQETHFLTSLKETLDNNVHYQNDDSTKAAILDRTKNSTVAPMRGKPCAVVKAHGTLKGAEENALRKVDIILGTIKLFTPLNSFSLKSYFGLQGEIIRHSIRSLLNYRLDKEEFHPKLEKTGYLYPFKINSDGIKLMKSMGINNVLRIIKKNNKTDLDKRIINSIIWFSKAYDVPILRNSGSQSPQSSEDTEFYNIGDKFLKLMVSLECILIFGFENKKENLSKRCSYILRDSFEERKKIQSFLRDSYNARSKIVHEGNYSVSVSDTYQLMEIVQHTIIKLIKSIGRWQIKTTEDLYQWFEKNRLKDRIMQPNNIS